MMPIPAPHESEATTADQAHHGLRLLGQRQMLANRPIPGPGPEPDAESSFEVRRVIGALKYHWFLFLVLGTLASAGLGALAWSLIPAKYTTYSILRVASNDSGVLSSGPSAYRNEFLTFLKTQADSIKSEYVLRAALRDSKIGNTATLADVDDKVRWLTENIQVEFSEHSEIMKVVLVGEYPQDSADIINAIDAAYMKEVVLVDQLKKKASLDTLEKSRQRLEEDLKNYKVKLEIKQKKNLPLQPSESLPLTAADQPAKVRVGATEFAQLNNELRKAEIDFTLAVEREKLIKARFDKVETLEVTATELNAMLERDLDYKDLVAKVERTEQFAETLRNVYASPTHADVKDAEKKAATAKTAVEDFKRKRKTDASREFQQANRRQLQDAVDKAAAEVQARNLLRQTIKKQLEGVPPPKDSIQAARDKSPTDYDTDESSLLFAIGIYEEVLKKLNVMAVDQQNAQPRVIELQKASVPIKKEMKKQVIGTAFAALFGFMLIGACITMYEGRIKRLFGSRDLSGNPALNLIGVLPEIGSSDAVAGGAESRGLKADPFMEAVEKVRVMLSRNFLGKRAQAILIGSAEPGEGKTTLAGHLAVSLTRTDRKTILVDANLRQPALHEHLGLPSQPGVCDLLRGEKGMPDVVQRTAINNLWFLSAGGWDADAQQALGRDRFRRVIDQLRQEFDYIILDSHALSPVADTYLIGQHCDAIVVCARKYVSRKPAVEQAYQKVCELGVPHTGLIFLGESK